MTNLKVAAGLADMVCGRYKAAAKQFLQANLDHVDFPEVSKILYFKFTDILTRLLAINMNWNIGMNVAPEIKFSCFLFHMC